MICCHPVVALGKLRVFIFQGSILFALQQKILSGFMYCCVPYQGGRLLCLGGSGSELESYTPIYSLKLLVQQVTL